MIFKDNLNSINGNYDSSYIGEKKAIEVYTHKYEEYIKKEYIKGLKALQIKEKVNPDENRQYINFFQNCFTFDISDLTFVLTDLINLFEGENYTASDSEVYYDLSQHQLEHRCTWAESAFEKICSRIITSEKEQKSNLFCSKHIIEILDDKKIIVLRGICSDGKFSFYNIDRLKNLEENAYYGDLEYVKDFVDSIIAYRIKHKLTKITKEELELFEYKFVLSRLNDIEKTLNSVLRLKGLKQRYEPKILTHKK